MNTTSVPSSAGLTVTPCAVIHAGSSLMMALPARAGRFPVVMTSMDEPLLSWISSDGRHEGVIFEGPDAPADHTAVLEQLMGDGLLVAEVEDITDADLNKATHHLMTFPEVQQRTERDR